jgi:cytochrome P450
MEAGEGSFFGTITLLYPKLVQWLCPVLDTGNEYFVELSKRILQERTEPAQHQDHQHQHHLTTEPDLIDRLLSCLNGNDTKGHQHINEFVAVAQITSTILTGYDLGTVLTRVLQCLTVNPEAQACCRREVREELDKFDGEIGFKLLTGLPYVEQCIREALRLYPTTSMTYRVCTKDKQYPGLLIPKGTSIECPIYIIQRDPAVYPEPLQYNPDRFAPGSSRSDRDPFLFMSFGQGPRGCFAQRFSMIVLKHCLVHLLPEFQFFRVAETRDPIKFTTGPSGMLTARDVFVGIRRLDS